MNARRWAVCGGGNGLKFRHSLCYPFPAAPRHPSLTLLPPLLPTSPTTHLPQVDGLALDVGFLVYNENTYPNLIGLFEVGAGVFHIFVAVCGLLLPPSSPART